MLTFIDERRQRIRKAREEGREEGFEEGQEAGYAKMVETLRRDPRIDAALRDNPEIRKALKELGFDLHDEKNGNG